MMADNDEFRARVRELEARNAALEAQLHEGGQMYHRALERARKLEAEVERLESKMRHMGDYNRKLKAEHDRCFHDSNAAATRHLGQMDRMQRKVDELESLVRDMHAHCSRRQPYVPAEVIAHVEMRESIEDRMRELGIEVES